MRSDLDPSNFLSASAWLASSTLIARSATLSSMLIAHASRCALLSQAPDFDGGADRIQAVAEPTPAPMLFQPVARRREMKISEQPVDERPSMFRNCLTAYGVRRNFITQLAAARNLPEQEVPYVGFSTRCSSRGARLRVEEVVDIFRSLPLSIVALKHFDQPTVCIDIPRAGI
jgi:hypothetical protein